MRKCTQVTQVNVTSTNDVNFITTSSGQYAQGPFAAQLMRQARVDVLDAIGQLTVDGPQEFVVPIKHDAGQLLVSVRVLRQPNGDLVFEQTWFAYPTEFVGNPRLKSWALHNLIAHPVSYLLLLVRLQAASDWLHDVTVPYHVAGRGDG